MIDKLNQLLEVLWARNPFFARKWSHAGVKPRQLAAMDELALFPLLTRAELLEDQAGSPPLGRNLTCPASALKRIHRSSGTSRAPVFWADDAESWAWVSRCSQSLYRLAGVEAGDRLFFALPFGPSSGPWIMYEGARRLGCCCFTAGNEPGEQSFYLKTFQPTVLVGKPLQLRSLGSALEAAGTCARLLGVEKLILTGESAPPDLRQQLEQLWAARCFERYGLTEAGSVASECGAHPGGLHLLETQFIAEVIDPETTQPKRNGEPGELVLTTLGRLCRPIVRYRTGDLVRLDRAYQCPCGRPEPLLLGGVSRLSPQTRENSPNNFALRTPEPPRVVSLSPQRGEGRGER